MKGEIEIILIIPISFFILTLEPGQKNAIAVYEEKFK